jgi:putative endopeptidase
MLLATESVGNWQTYLRFHVADSFAPYLSSQFVQENFDFPRKYLRGAKEPQPRWKRCVEYTDANLGEALGRAYVRSAINIVPDDLLVDIRNAVGFEEHRHIDQIGKPVDVEEWSMTPLTVNAGCTPQKNEIMFPAGVLQPPKYDIKMDDAPNYGDTGSNIGHELTHGFDDLGRQFDAKGNLRDWWSKEDADKFKERTQCIEDQYARYVVIDDVRVNGKLTLGEDVADLGGSILAYIAWKGTTQDKQLESIDGLSPDPRFFVGFAQWACANERPEELRVRAASDPHTTAQHRINGVVVNMRNLKRHFSVSPGAAWYR